MNYCPCCSSLLLEHIRGADSYWFCRHCWQEMPVYNLNKSSSFTESVMGKLPRKTQKVKSRNTTVYAKQWQPINEWIGLQDLSV
jgi:DNA-directed RNA polymerase subunit M/transcription elongation factor TFIIS